jgi:hypothetical protein
MQDSEEGNSSQAGASWQAQQRAGKPGSASGAIESAHLAAEVQRQRARGDKWKERCAKAACEQATLAECLAAVKQGSERRHAELLAEASRLQAELAGKKGSALLCAATRNRNP